MNPIAILSDIMIQILNFFYTFSGSYGYAVVLLTVAINIALYPLTLQSTRQMSAIQKLQPKIKELQEKHKGKPDQLQKETMELYSKEKVNPLGGCLPLLLKIPFFLAIFFALQSQEFKQIIMTANVNDNFLWISDLAKPDPTYVMAILIGITTYISQITMQQTQQNISMTYIMPFFIAFISVPFPAGVQLYWVTSNLITGLQQYYINKTSVSRETKKGAKE